MDVNEFDLNFGGVQYANANELWTQEGVRPDSSVNDVILKLEKARLDKMPAAPAPQPYQAPPAPPAPQPYQAPRPLYQAPLYQRNEQQKMQYEQQKLQQEQQKLQQEQQKFQQEQQRQKMQPVQMERVYSYSPILYNRLYDWSLGYIPSYYTYEQRKRLEDLLAVLIRSELSNKYSVNRSKYELEQIIRDNIKKFNADIPVVKKTPRKVSKKPVKKSSKKPSKTKKTSKSKKKASKKPSKKPSKKKSAKKTAKK